MFVFRDLWIRIERPLCRQVMFCFPNRDDFVQTSTLFSSFTLNHRPLQRQFVVNTVKIGAVIVMLMASILFLNQCRTKCFTFANLSFCLPLPFIFWININSEIREQIVLTKQSPLHIHFIEVFTQRDQKVKHHASIY